MASYAAAVSSSTLSTTDNIDPTHSKQTTPSSGVEQPPPQSNGTTSQSSKPIHTIILDASPLLLSQPSLSTLLANAHVLRTTPSVLAEIRDPSARLRVENIYTPFIEVRKPREESLKTARESARKTGDLSVLSGTDLEVAALALESDRERKEAESEDKGKERGEHSIEKIGAITEKLQDLDLKKNQVRSIPYVIEEGQLNDGELNFPEAQDRATDGPHTTRLESGSLTNESLLPVTEQTNEVPRDVEIVEEESHEYSSEDDSGGWITPSNLKRHQAKDEGAALSSKSEFRTMHVGTITGDFALQNLLLQMKLNLLSSSTCKRIQKIRTTILRCHGCFATCKDMTKQFCPRCGKPTLTRVTCTTNDKGEVKMHLKRNMQWNNKGNVFSIPKPTSGSSNQKWKGPRSGGGRGGWGNDLILAPDQKEYVRAMAEHDRVRRKDLMDEDTLPNILSGDRPTAGGKPRVGAGRGINSKKRR
ncbi:MAG: hypothetical protein Q9227_003446 [Pyrenula ochraceoflavens]